MKTRETQIPYYLWWEWGGHCRCSWKPQVREVRNSGQCARPSLRPVCLALHQPLLLQHCPSLGGWCLCWGCGWLWTHIAEVVASCPCKWGLSFPGSPKHRTPGPAVRTGVPGPCLPSQGRIQERRTKVKCKAKSLLKRKVHVERCRANSERESCLGEV